MSNVRVFGVTSPILADGTIRFAFPPDVTGIFTATVDLAKSPPILHVKRCSLTIASRHRLEWIADIRLKPDPTHTGDLCPLEGANPQPGGALLQLWDSQDSDTPTSTMGLGIGPFRVQLSLDARTLQGSEGDLAIAFSLPIPLVAGGDLPVSVALQEQVRLDLLNRVFRFADGAFGMQCSTPLTVAGEIFSGFKRFHVADAVEWPLQASVPDLQLTFSPKTSDSLPLYVDFANPTAPATLPHERNPLLAAVSLRNYRIGATFVSQNRKSTLNRLFVRGGSAGGFGLRASAYSDLTNQAVVATLDQELDLHVRVNRVAKPATLLIAPQYTEPNAASSSALRARIPTGPIHGIIEHTRFDCLAGAALVCADREVHAGSVPDGVSPGLLSEMTVPWLSFLGAKVVAHIAKPADAYLRDASAEVETYSVEGNSVALPLLTPNVYARSGNAVARAVNVKIDGILSGLRYTLPTTTHETGFQEAPLTSSQVVQVAKIFSAHDDGGKPQLKQHKISLDYGIVKLNVTVPDQYDPKYFLIVANDPSTGFASPTLKFSPDTQVPTFDVSALPGGRARSKPGNVLAIVKLSRTTTLNDIFTLEGIDPKTVGPGINDLHFLNDVLDRHILSEAAWVGLVMFSLPVEINAKQPIMQTLFGQFTSSPGNPLQINYLAITPKRDGEFSTTGRLVWQNTNPPPAPGVNEQEARFQIERVDVSWSDSTIQKFYANGRLQFDSFLGLRAPRQPVRIVGSYDRNQKKIRFLGQFDKAVTLLPSDNTFGPLEQISISGAEINFRDGETAIEISGDVALRNFNFGGQNWLSSLPKSIGFDSLRIALPTGWDKLTLRISYPSFHFVFDKPPFNFGFIAVQLRSIWVEWPGISAFDWSGTLPVVSFPNSISTGIRVMFEFRLELMKMPELAMPGLDRLVLNMFFGLGQVGGRWSEQSFAIGIRAFSFQRLNINLMRFLEIEAKDVEFRPVKIGSDTINWLQLRDVKVKIIGATMIEKVSFWLFSSSTRGTGFIAIYANRDATGLVQLRWALLGHNITVDQGFAKQLMIPESQSDGQDRDIREKYLQKVRIEDFVAGTALNQGGWIFAASFSFVGILDGKFLFQDHAYYGVAIGGPILDEIFGPGFAISVLYIKRDQPDQDAFVIAVRIPRVTIPPIAFTGGVISIEIVMNGGFTLDIGFPALRLNGSRDWSRAFGAIVTPFQGSGGFYIRKHHFSSVTNNNEFLQLSAGYAVQFGLGASYDGGPFHVWATIGVYFILEGDVVLNLTDPNDRIHALRLVGAVGILVRAAGELNWWVISIRVEITLSAEARATLSYGDLPILNAFAGPQALLPAEQRLREFHNESLALAADSAWLAARPLAVSAKKATLSVDLTVYASVEAEACIGGGWFRICAGIRVEVPIRCHFELTLSS